MLLSVTGETNIGKATGVAYFGILLVPLSLAVGPLFAFKDAFAA